MFSNEQIVCIEYMKITEDNKYEIFRVPPTHIFIIIVPHSSKLASTIWHGPQLHREDESGSPDPTASTHSRACPRICHAPTLAGFDDRRDAAFRWIAQSLQTNLDPRPILKRTTSTTAQQTTWLKDTAPFDPAWKLRVQYSYKPLIDTISAYPECLKVTRRPAIAPVDLVMMVLLVFEFHESYHRRVPWVFVLLVVVACSSPSRPPCSEASSVLDWLCCSTWRREAVLRAPGSDLSAQLQFFPLSLRPSPFPLLLLLNAHLL
jgi:hypothetical protein